MLSIVLSAMMLSPSPAVSAPVAYSAQAEKKVCKRVGQVGSRISSGKVCLSRAEWERISRDNRKEWEDKGSSGR